MDTLDEIMAIVDGFESEDKSAFVQDVLSMLSYNQLEKILKAMQNGEPLPVQ